MVPATAPSHPATVPARRDDVRPRGRPRDPARARAILEAALEGLAEVGYDRLSMEDIAARAGVGKGALYRRWSSKGALVVDAMLQWREQVAPITAPDSGSLAGDLAAIAAEVPELDDAARRQFRVLMGLMGAATHDPALREALAESGFGRPRRAILEVLDRAVARGEIAPEIDISVVPDLVMGANLVQMVVLGEPPTREQVEHVLFDVVYPLVTRSTSRGHGPGGRSA